MEGGNDSPSMMFRVSYEGLRFQGKETWTRRQSADQCGCSGRAHKLAYIILSILVHVKFSIKKKRTYVNGCLYRRKNQR